ESEITRERLALEEAIRKVEAEAARKSRFDPPPERKRTDRGGDADQFKVPPPPRPASEAADEQGDEAAAAATLSGTAADLRRRNAPASERPVAGDGLQGFRNVVADVESLGDATAQAGRAAREAYNQMPAPSPEFDRLEPRLEPEGLRSRDRRPAAREQRRDALREAPRETSREAPPRPAPASRVPAPPARDAYAPRVPRDAAAREPAPRERPGSRSPPPPRERPAGRNGASQRDLLNFELPQQSEPTRADEFSANDFASDFEAARKAAQDPDFESGLRGARGARRAAAAAPAMPAARAAPADGRSYGRLLVYLAIVMLLVVVGGGVAWQWRPIVTQMRGLMAQRTTSPPAPQQEAPPVQKKITDRIGSSMSAAQPSAQNADEAAAVAQRVVLYEEDPEDPQGKRFVGSAVWHTDGAQTTGAGQAADSTVRADIEIPERKMTVKWVLKRNTDKTLPASHTIEINFMLPSDFPHGGIKNIAGVIMKESEEKPGTPLAGYSVKVTDGYFLLGLSASDSDQQRNLSLLKDRPWFDIPIVYNDGRRAILAVEKGIPGDRVFKDAFAAWKQ
ncbi:MAG TPA: hypothetical protein VGG01_04550, partial [Xanthobacteraceae bacterium]